MTRFRFFTGFRLFSLALVVALISPSTATIFAQQRRSGSAAATQRAASVNRNAANAAQNITAAQLRRDLFVIASDEMRGRDTPSPELDRAAELIADRMRRAGLRGGGDNGTFFQTMMLTRSRVNPAETQVEINGRAFRFGQDFLPGNANANTSGQLVYAGHGWVVRSKNIDAYRGIDVRDKFVVVLGGNRPPGITAEDVSGRQGTDWQEPFAYARANGARGMILIPRAAQPHDSPQWRNRQRSLERGALEVEAFAAAMTGGSGANAGTPLPTLTIGPEMVNALFAGEQADGAEIMRRANGEAGAAFALAPDKTLRLNINLNTQRVPTRNVIAIYDGGDRRLRNEYVAVGAHYDHVGVGAPDQSGDTIYNGADDDGSGTVAMIAMAEALARSRTRPRRSFVFIWHAGEEKGLWGARYFAENPTIPLNQIVAQLNIDMIGRSRRPDDTSAANRDLTGPNEVYLIGPTIMSDDLGELSARVNRGYLNLTFNNRYDNLTSPDRFFFRSDHYHYARNGIPALFYFSGVHEDYHRPSDTPDKIDYEKLERIARTIFVTGWEIADRTERPRVNAQLPPELQRR